jgi:C-terminal processing protease CtpA/Prc
MNKHIRFDDEEDNDTDITKSNHTMMDIDKKDDQIDSSTKIILTLILRKDMKSQEKSFGFQLMGNKNEEGNHYVSHVEPNSPSSRADLKSMDKIIKVNGFDVRNFTINELFDYLEYETSLNEYKLVLVVERKPSAAKRSSCKLIF